MIEIGVNDILAYQKHAVHVFQNLGYYLNQRKKMIEEMTKIDPNFVKRSKKIVFFGKIVSEENGDFHEIKLHYMPGDRDPEIDCSILFYEQVLASVRTVETLIYPNMLDCITKLVYCEYCREQLGFKDIGAISRADNSYSHIHCEIEELNRKNRLFFTEALNGHAIVNCKPTENGYGSKLYRGDWFVFTLVGIGDVRIGWRKRVIDVEFIDYCNRTKRNLQSWKHPQGNVTVYENGFHCYVNHDAPSLFECIESAIKHMTTKGD